MSEELEIPNPTLPRVLREEQRVDRFYRTSIGAGEGEVLSRPPAQPSLPIHLRASGRRRPVISQGAGLRPLGRPLGKGAESEPESRDPDRN